MNAAIPTVAAGTARFGLVRQFATACVARLQNLHQHRRRDLRLCESLSLGERRFVAVIQFKNQRFLVGGTNTNIALLDKLPTDGDEP